MLLAYSHHFASPMQGLRGSCWWEESLYEGRIFLSTPADDTTRDEGAVRAYPTSEPRYSVRWLVLSRLPATGIEGLQGVPVLSAYYSGEDFRAGSSPVLTVPLHTSCHVALEGNVEEEDGSRWAAPHSCNHTLYAGYADVCTAHCSPPPPPPPARPQRVALPAS